MSPTSTRSAPRDVPLNTLHHFAHHWEFVVGDERVSHIPRTCDIFEVCELAMYGGAETKEVADRVRAIARAEHERGVPIDVNRTVWMADTTSTSVLDLMVRSKFHAGAHALVHPYHVDQPILVARDEQEEPTTTTTTITTTTSPPSRVDDEEADKAGRVVAHVQSPTLHACLASACAMDDVCAVNVLTRCASPSRLLRVWLTPWRCPHTRVVFPTLLHFAVRCGSWKVIRPVLKDLACDESARGTLVQRMHRVRRDVLALACESADVTCVRALLECDALTRSRPSGGSAGTTATAVPAPSFALDGTTFASAVKACIASVSARTEVARVEVLLELLSAQARLVRARHRNRDVECALARAAMLACEHGRAACLCALLQYADSLDAALFSGGVLKRRVLLGGKKPDSTSGMAFTAARCRDAGCLRVLAEHGGVDVLARYELEVHDARGEAETRSLLHLACEWGARTRRACCWPRARARTKRARAGGRRCTLPRRATCRRASWWTCWWRAGAPTGATTDATEAAPPCTASMIAAARGNADALRRLLAAAGTRSRDVGDEARAMRCALERGHTACARALIERGVDAFADAAAMSGDGEGTTAPLSAWAWPGGEVLKEGDDAMARLLASAKRVRAGWLWRRARDVVARGVVRMRRGDGRADGAVRKRKRE